MKVLIREEKIIEIEFSLVDGEISKSVHDPRTRWHDTNIEIVEFALLLIVYDGKKIIIDNFFGSLQLWVSN